MADGGVADAVKLCCSFVFSSRISDIHPGNSPVCDTPSIAIHHRAAREQVRGSVS